MAQDTQVARPVAAPNYIGMYSEAIRGALEPMQQLLAIQKEYSDEDYKKAQIQNFLQDHQDKRDALAETTRSHMADESMTALERQLEGRRVDESVRHDQADEAHQGVQDDLAQQREKEYERANQADEEQKKLDFGLRSASQDADIAYKKAKTSRTTIEAQKLATENEQKANDDQVIAEANQWIQHRTPEEIYSSQDNPEISQGISDLYSRVHTVEGRLQLDQIIGAKQTLGQEIADRKEINGFTGEAKRVFQQKMLDSDPSEPIQSRFNDALVVGRQAQGQYEERQKWGSTGQQMYQQMLNSGKSPEEAMAAGRSAEFTMRTTEKQKPVPMNPKAVDEIKAAISKPLTKNPGESNADFEARQSAADADATQKALELDQLQRSGQTDEFNQRMQQYMAPPAVKSVDDFAKKLRPGGQPALPTGTPAPADANDAPTNTSLSLPATGGGGIRMASAGSGDLLPSGARRYSADSGISQLASILNTQFGENKPAQPDEEELPQETATV